MSFFELFRKKNASLPTAIIFVDFEHWCISLSRLHNMRPQVRNQYEEITKRFNVIKMLFFGDFTNPLLRNEMDGIREVTNNIIDTQNPSLTYKKDYTDFIMLDCIYQEADENPKADTYILFTGDGHFSSVVRYLKIKKKKKIIIYGVKGAVSGKLKSIADECIEFPNQDDERVNYYKMLIENFDYLFKQGQKNVYPTFLSTVKYVAVRYHVCEDNVRTALMELIDMGVIVKKEERIGFSRTIRTLHVDWEKAIEKGLWSAEHAL
ncbi:MAG: NYN domain-containing protein [Oscillospiraceae bacterium]|nr:NYN domain-containing protein [Oscillospiraceae bacterium]